MRASRSNHESFSKVSDGLSGARENQHTNSRMPLRLRVRSGGNFLTLSWNGRYTSSVSSCEKRGASCRTPNSFLVCVEFFWFREPIKWALRIEWPKHFLQLTFCSMPPKCFEYLLSDGHAVYLPFPNHVSVHVAAVASGAREYHKHHTALCVSRPQDQAGSKLAGNNFRGWPRFDWRTLGRHRRVLG